MKKLLLIFGVLLLIGGLIGIALSFVVSRQTWSSDNGGGSCYRAENSLKEAQKIAAELKNH